MLWEALYLMWGKSQESFLYNGIIETILNVNGHRLLWLFLFPHATQLLTGGSISHDCWVVVFLNHSWISCKCCGYIYSPLFCSLTKSESCELLEVTFTCAFLKNGLMWLNSIHLCLCGQWEIWPDFLQVGSNKKPLRFANPQHVLNVSGKCLQDCCYSSLLPKYCIFIDVSAYPAKWSYSPFIIKVKSHWLIYQASLFNIRNKHQSLILNYFGLLQ